MMSLQNSQYLLISSPITIFIPKLGWATRQYLGRGWLGFPLFWLYSIQGQLYYSLSLKKKHNSYSEPEVNFLITIKRSKKSNWLEQKTNALYYKNLTFSLRLWVTFIDSINTSWQKRNPKLHYGTALWSEVCTQVRSWTFTKLKAQKQQLTRKKMCWICVLNMKTNLINPSWNINV